MVARPRHPYRMVVHNPNPKPHNPLISYQKSASEAESRWCFSRCSYTAVEHTVYTCEKAPTESAVDVSEGITQAEVLQRCICYYYYTRIFHLHSKIHYYHNTIMEKSAIYQGRARMFCAIGFRPTTNKKKGLLPEK